MRTIARTVACSTVLTMLLWTLPFSGAAGATGRLDGLVLGTDGKPAVGSTIYVIDGEGKAARQAVVGADGMYSVPDVPPGSYSLGIETAAGQVGPVVAPPVRIDEGRLVRRDVKLSKATPELVDQTVHGNYSFGSWFSGLGAGAKTGVVLGFLVAAYGVVELVDDDSKESVSTPSGIVE